MFFFFAFPHLHLFPLSVGDPDLAPRPEREAEEVEGQGAGQRVVDGDHVAFFSSGEKIYKLSRDIHTRYRLLNAHMFCTTHFDILNAKQNKKGILSLTCGVYV